MNNINNEPLEQSIIEQLNEQIIEELKEQKTEPLKEQINEIHNDIEMTVINIEREVENINNDNIDKYKSKLSINLDQDTIQRISVFFQFLLEMYRVITSSLLILFVPQLCDDHICTISENLVFETNTYNTALCFNFISMFILVIMYYLELVRENRMIKYLSVNPNLSNDNENVGERLEELSISKRNKIHSVNKNYRYSFYLTIIIYTLNILLSIAVISTFYAGSQTASTLITYILFMATKLNSVYSLISTEQNIFYSAYMKTNVQYNDLDSDFKVIN